MTLISSLLALISLATPHGLQGADRSVQAILDQQVSLTYHSADIRLVVPQLAERYGLSGWMDVDVQGQVFLDAEGPARLRDVFANILRQVNAKIDIDGAYVHVVKVDTPATRGTTAPILKQAVAMTNDEEFSYELDEGELRKVAKSDLNVVLKTNLEPLPEVKHYNLGIPKEREKFVGMMRLCGARFEIAPEFTKQIDLDIPTSGGIERILQQICEPLDLTYMVLGGLYRCMGREDVNSLSGQTPPAFYLMKMKLAFVEPAGQKQGITCDDKLLYALSGGWRYEIRKSDLKVVKSTTADGF